MQQNKFAKKHLGQNFLTSTDVRDKILAEAGDLKGKQILEIGPGLGFLTEALLEAGANLTAIELDERAFNILNKKFDQEKSFTLLNQDILQTDLDGLFGNDPYAVIANIPYNITNPIIRKLLEKTQNQPKFCLLMVQKEVAQKICDPIICHSGLGPESNNKSEILEQVQDDRTNQPFGVPLQGVAQPSQKKKKSKRSILSIAVEVYAQARYCFTVGRELFEPAPKVDSAIMRFDIRSEALVPNAMRRDFFTVVNAGFSEKRKKVGNVLGKFFGIPSDRLLGDIDGNRRAETLTVEEWVNITKNFKNQLNQ